MLEPCPRNTTPVAAVAAQLVSDFGDGLALLLPSDHYIPDTQSFVDAIAQSAPVAQDGSIVTLGITPTFPATGFGYIRPGDEIGSKIRKVAEFCEKPDAEKAESYFTQKSHFWNAGIFLFSPERMLAELEEYAGDTLASTRSALKNAARTGDAIVLEEASFAKCDSISIDYSVMENTAYAAVFPGLSCGWNDVGSWDAVANLTSSATADSLVEMDNTDCYFHTDGKINIAAVGLTGLVVVSYDGNLLIVPKERAQDVSKLLKDIKSRGLTDFL